MLLLPGHQAWQQQTGFIHLALIQSSVLSVMRLDSNEQWGIVLNVLFPTLGSASSLFGHFALHLYLSNRMCSNKILIIVSGDGQRMHSLAHLFSVVPSSLHTCIQAAAM